MQITTKFNITDYVYFLEDNKVNFSKIIEININIQSNKVISSYCVDSSNLDKFKNENQLFATKQELLDSL